MTQTCKPVLIPQYPLPKIHCDDYDLPDPTQVFSDFRTAKPGEPVGIRFTVVHRDNVLNAIGPGTVLLSNGPGQEMDNVDPREALQRNDLHDAMLFLIHAPAILQNLENVRWYDFGWSSSCNKYGYHLRELWIFPRAALLMNNIHSCFIEDTRELAYQSQVMHDKPTSNHDAFGLASYLNELLKVTSPAAIPAEVDEWPKGVPKGTIPFLPIDPARLAA